MLAKATDYLGLWQLPVFLALGAVWVFCGGYLLRRAVRPHVARSQSRVGRCFRVTFLAGLCGALAGGILMFLVATLADYFDFTTFWPAALVSQLTFLAISSIVLYASFELPASLFFRIFVRAFVMPALVVAAVGTPTGWYAYAAQQREIARQYSISCLRVIHDYIRERYARDQPPKSLELLLAPKGAPKKETDRDRLPGKYLKAWVTKDRAIDYFYLPAPIRTPAEKSQRILACDFIDNHDGRWRAVLFTNGDTRWCSGEDFAELLKLPENQAFGAALQQAEKRPR